MADIAQKPGDLGQQREIRLAMRDFITPRVDGAKSTDVGSKSKGQNSYGMMPTKDLPGAYAFHDWEGRVVLRQDTHDKARDGLRRIKELAKDGGIENVRAKASEYSPTLDAVRTLLHEEMHGFSKIEKTAYRGIGVGMEEAQTEILARKVSRELVGETGADPQTAKFWPLPKLEFSQGAKEYRTAGRPPAGSYHDYIGGLMEACANSGSIPPDRVGKAVEQALLGGLKGPKAKTPEAAVDRFVKNLAKQEGLTDRQKWLLESKLKSPSSSPLRPPT
jgi:hypothetical protein